MLNEDHSHRWAYHVVVVVINVVAAVAFDHCH